MLLPGTGSIVHLVVVLGATAMMGREVPQPALAVM
jgi:hypothetical protein